MDECDPVDLIECLRQQHIGFRRGRIGFEVVAAIEENRIDLLGRHELQHRNLVLLGNRQFREILVGQNHLVALGRFIGLVDIGVSDRLSAHGADTVVSDPSAVLGVDLMKPDVMVLGGGIDLHRDIHQPERDGTLPDRPHPINATFDQSVLSGKAT